MVEPRGRNEGPEGGIRARMACRCYLCGMLTLNRAAGFPAEASPARCGRRASPWSRRTARIPPSLRHDACSLADDRYLDPLSGDRCRGGRLLSAAWDLPDLSGLSRAGARRGSLLLLTLAWMSPGVRVRLWATLGDFPVSRSLAQPGAARKSDQGGQVTPPSCRHVIMWAAGLALVVALRRARFVCAGLSGQVVARLSKPHLSRPACRARTRRAAHVPRPAIRMVNRDACCSSSRGSR